MLIFSLDHDFLIGGNPIKFLRKFLSYFFLDGHLPMNLLVRMSTCYFHSVLYAEKYKWEPLWKLSSFLRKGRSTYPRHFMVTWRQVYECPCGGCPQSGDGQIEVTMTWRGSKDAGIFYSELCVNNRLPHIFIHIWWICLSCAKIFPSFCTYKLQKSSQWGSVGAGSGRLKSLASEATWHLALFCKARAGPIFVHTWQWMCIWWKLHKNL